MITKENISIQSSFDISVLIDMQIEIKEGEHGKLILIGYLSDDVKRLPKNGDEITILSKVQESELQEVLFCGMIQRALIYMENGIRKVELMAATHSVQLDEEEKSHSYQDIKMTYMQIIDQILLKYHGKSICANSTKKTGMSMLQYNETDWQFIRRLAGCAGLAVFCDEKAGMPCLLLGYRDNGKKVMFSENSYKCQVSENYYRVWKEAGTSKDEFLHYQVESMQNFDIGDYAYYKGQVRYIYKKRAEWKNDAMIFYYYLGGKCHFERRKEYNEKITGLALAGSIIRTEEEKVYIKLDIDGEEGKAMYPYPWSPVTGNLLYCVPQSGTRAYLCFPDCHEERAFVGNSIRMDSQCGIPETSQCRLIETEHGKQLQLYENNIAVKGGQEPTPQIISMEPTGCILTAGNGGIVIAAAEKVILKAPIIVLRTPMEINQVRSYRLASGKKSILKKKGSRNPATGGDVSFSMQYEFSGMAEQGVLYGSAYEKYLPFKDAPKYSIDYPLISKILAGVAVALVVGAAVGVAVFFAAPAMVAVAGATITALQVGAFAGAVTAGVGIAATAVTAANDDGTTTMGEYLQDSFKSSVEIGAVFLDIFLNMPILVPKELETVTGYQFNDDLNEVTDIETGPIWFPTPMNPRLLENPRNNIQERATNTTNISQADFYQNPQNGKSNFSDREHAVTGGVKLNRNSAVEEIKNSALQAKKGGETVAGHALQKHAGRHPEMLEKVSENPEAIDNRAMKHINDILNGPGEFKVVESNGRMFLEKLLLDGRGIRLNMDGTFKDFIDPIRQ